jgi:hypothetical protein
MKMGWGFKHIVKRENGAVLVVVLFVMIIVMFLGVAFLDMGTSEALMGDYFKDSVQAFYIAEGGLQKSLSMLKTDPEYKRGELWAGFLSDMHELGAGFYSISIDEIGTGKMKLVSTGRVHKSVAHIETEVLVAKVDPVFYNAISISNTDLKLSGGSSIYGDIYVDGGLDLKGTSEVTGDIRATGKVSGKENVQGRVSEDVKRQTFPSFGAEQYKKMSKEQDNYHDEDFECSHLYLSGIMFVEGDVVVDTISGDGLLYATGDIIVKEGEVSRGSQCPPLLISEGCFTIKKQHSGGDANVNAGIFAKDFKSPQGNVSLFGFIAAEGMSLAGNMEIRYDPTLVETKNYPFPGSTDDEVKIMVLYYSETNPGYPDPKDL